MIVDTVTHLWQMSFANHIKIVVFILKLQAIFVVILWYEYVIFGLDKMFLLNQVLSDLPLWNFTTLFLVTE